MNALENLGIRADKADKSRNIPAVMITAEIGPLGKSVTKIDETVSSIGNADSLQGGILLQTPSKDRWSGLWLHKERFQLVVCRQGMRW